MCVYLHISINEKTKIMTTLENLDNATLISMLLEAQADTNMMRQENNDLQIQSQHNEQILRNQLQKMTGRLMIAQGRIESEL